MSQPEQPDEGLTAGEIIAAAAIGLALIALERRTQQQVEDDIDAAFKLIIAAAIVVASTAPATILTGAALISLPVLHGAITTNLIHARENIAATIEAAYSAAASLAHTKITADLAEHGYTVPGVLPELGDNIDRLMSDVDTMVGHIQSDVQNSIVTAFDGVTGDNAGPARIVAIRQALTGTQGRFQQRANAAASVAVHKGANDAQQAIFSQYQQDTHVIGLLKQWRTTSNNPCGMCEALNGTTVGINAEFDAAATTDDKDWRHPWRSMLTPPRHPNCRCQLQLIRV